MVLEINQELMGYTFSEKSRIDTENNYPEYICEKADYIFDPDTFTVCESGTDEAETVENPIKFPSVTRLEAQKAYVNFLNDKKISTEFNGLDDKDYVKKFWNYFDDGGEKFCEFTVFEKYYRIKIIIDWCGENNIPYYIKDPFIKSLLEKFNNYCGFSDR